MTKPKSFYPSPAIDASDAFDALDEPVEGPGGAAAGSDGASRPKILNAFDLVNQCGGFALDKLFCPQIDILANEHGHLVRKVRTCVCVCVCLSCTHSH